MWREYIMTQDVICRAKEHNSIVGYDGVYIIPEDKYIELIIHEIENEENKNKVVDKP